jgi:hypothetical protein
MAWLNAPQMEAIIQHIGRVNGIDEPAVQRLIASAERKKIKMDAVNWKPKIHERLKTKYPALRLIRL